MINSRKKILFRNQKHNTAVKRLFFIYVPRGQIECQMNVLSMFLAAENVFWRSKLLTSMHISSKHGYNGILIKVRWKAQEARGLTQNNSSYDQKHYILQMMNNFSIFGPWFCL